MNLEISSSNVRLLQPTTRFTETQEKALATFEDRIGELGYEGISLREQHCEALLGLEGDVMNGGLGLYSYNSSGDLALVALQALAELGAWQTRAALDSAIKKIWPSKYPEQRIENWTLYTRMQILE